MIGGYADMVCTDVVCQGSKVVTPKLTPSVSRDDCRRAEVRKPCGQEDLSNRFCRYIGDGDRLYPPGVPVNVGQDVTLTQERW